MIILLLKNIILFYLFWIFVHKLYMPFMWYHQQSNFDVREKGVGDSSAHQPTPLHYLGIE